jgi:hypothetical protein
MFIDFSPENPFRSVDWRWQLASTLRREGIPPRRRRRFDAWVRAAAKYQDRRDAPRGPRHDPLAAVAEALRLRSGADERLRHEIELRLLAGQRYDDVAARCSIPVAVVEAYERVFFNVVERLRSPDYIASVVDPTMSVLFGEPTLDVVLKKIAYGYGPACADVLAGYLDGQGPVGIDPDLDRALRRLIAVLSVPVNEATAPAWIRLGEIVERHVREAAAESATPLAMPVAVAGEIPAGILDRLAIQPDDDAVGVIVLEIDAIILDWRPPAPDAETVPIGRRPPGAAVR